MTTTTTTTTTTTKLRSNRITSVIEFVIEDQKEFGIYGIGGSIPIQRVFGSGPAKNIYAVRSGLHVSARRACKLRTQDGAERVPGKLPVRARDSSEEHARHLSRKNEPATKFQTYIYLLALLVDIVRENRMLQVD
uniref:Uncharacterized protein n=1 Tax=Vespula pensylvanica TaxID=30213 RepID=A0A834UI04_VESPE|nr:hypothetical protein H0235_001803 [Vespula pensylvanica]